MSAMTTELPTIARGNIYSFEGLPGASVGSGVGGNSYDAGGYIKVKDISYTGTLRVNRGTRSINGDFRFTTELDTLTITDAHAMIANGVWRKHKH